MFYTLSDYPEIFVDAYAIDHQDNLCFLSCFGNETLIQEVRAKLSLPPKDSQRLDTLWFYDNKQHPKDYCNVPDVSVLGGLQNKVNHTQFHGLTHFMVFNHLCCHYDRANQRGIAVSMKGESTSEFKARIWNIVMSITTCPLLNEWKEVLLHELIRLEKVRFLNNTHGLQACEINLGSDFESLVSTLIQTRRLAA